VGHCCGFTNIVDYELCPTYHFHALHVAQTRTRIKIPAFNTR